MHSGRISPRRNRGRGHAGHPVTSPTGGVQCPPGSRPARCRVDMVSGVVAAVGSVDLRPELPPPRVALAAGRGRRASRSRSPWARVSPTPVRSPRRPGRRPGHVRGLHYRHAPAIAHARRPVRSGALGRITNVRCRFDADYSSSPHGPRTWRFVKAQAGSGVLGRTCCRTVSTWRSISLARSERSRRSPATVIPERPQGRRAASATP